MHVLPFVFVFNKRWESEFYIVKLIQDLYTIACSY